MKLGKLAKKIKRLKYELSWEWNEDKVQELRWLEQLFAMHRAQKARLAAIDKASRSIKST